MWVNQEKYLNHNQLSLHIPSASLSSTQINLFFSLLSQYLKIHLNYIPMEHVFNNNKLVTQELYLGSPTINPIRQAHRLQSTIDMESHIICHRSKLP